MLETLEKYYEDGYLIKQVHPTLPLTIWNYSQTTQYEKKWDEITLMSRGLVTENVTGKIVARPFKKFFNIEEGMHNVGTGEFEVFEKMDGSLGILFNYEGKWVFASRGSFTSDQAIKFKEIFDKKYITTLDDSFTYMFEIIYPENRIVVDYEGLEDIVMLGKIRTNCGTEYDVEWYKDCGFNVVKKYDGIKDFKELKEIINDNQEGFVVHFNSTGSKMKVKGEEYVRLHRIMTQVSTKSIWEILANGGNMEEILVNVPDEFYDKIREYEEDLIHHYNFMEATIRAEFKVSNTKMGVVLDDKSFALRIANNPLKGFLFSLRKDKDIKKAIWNFIKPDYKPL